MARHEYTISLRGTDDWDRATIFEEEEGWYYSLRQADPHGEEYAGDSVGPFSTAAEAERKAKESLIPPPDEA
ncbi:MAG: hypothetical protein ACYC1C_07350 [Chloroflexota bacterium]